MAMKKHTRAMGPLGSAFLAAAASFGVEVAIAKASKKVEAQREASAPASGRDGFRMQGSAPSSRSEDLQSLGGKGGTEASLGNTSQGELLKSRSATPRSERTKVEPTKQLDAMRALAKNGLKLGVYRSQQLSGGEVAAPGLRDFAAYFRAGGAAAADAQARAHARTQASDKGKLIGESSKAEMSREAQAEQLRAQTVESIRKILVTKISTEQRLDLLLRLAQLQTERHAYFLETEVKAFNEAHDKWDETRKGPEPVFAASTSNAHLLAGTEALRAAVTQFPNHARTPEALFQLGFLLTQMQSDSASLYFERLVRNFPKSDRMPDALLALGEYNFSKARFDKAQGFYQKVLGYKGSVAYNYAVYKLGWTYFNLRPSTKDGDNSANLNKALAAFRLVVKLADSPNADPVLKGLRGEALKDMVLVFAETGDVDGAQKYFESLGERDLYLTLLERLAWQHTEDGAFAQATKIYERLIAETPTHPRLPVHYGKLAELNEKNKNRAALIATLTQASAAFAPGSQWTLANAKNKGSLQEAAKFLRADVLAWAERIHSEGQTTKRNASFDEALAVYTIHVQNWDGKAESYRAHFFRGEILALRERYLEASDEYMKAAALDMKFGIKGKYTEDALLNTISCVDLTLAKAPQPKLPEIGKAPQKIALTTLHEKLVKAIDMHRALFPADEQNLALTHRAASVLYAFGDYDTAQARWAELTKKNPKSKEAADGMRLVLKVYVERKDWQGAAAQARTFLGMPGVADAAVAKDLTNVLKGSIFEQGLAYEKADMRQEAAQLFLAFHKDFQGDPDAPKALFNAANNQFKLGKIDDAVGTLRTLLAQYPKFELAAKAHYLIASSLDALGMFNESAQSYEQLALETPSAEHAPDALFRAAEQRLAAGDADHAVETARKLVARYPTSRLVGQGHMLMGEAYEAKQMPAQAVKGYAGGAEIVMKNQPALAGLLYAKAARVAFDSGYPAQSQRFNKLALASLEGLQGKQKDSQEALEGLRAAGLNEVALLDRQLPAFQQKAISDGTQIAAQFGKIRDEATSLAQRYVYVTKLGSAEPGIAALYRVAELQEHLSAVLLAAPIPKDAKPDEVEQMKSTLERIALPLQDEAANLYLTAWQRANETEAMTPFVAKLHEKLVVLRPGEFKRASSVLPLPSYYSSELVLNDSTRGIVRD